MKPELAHARVVFLETSVVIYYVEAHPVFSPPIRELFEAIDRGEKSGVSSYVTLYEVLTKPFEVGRDDLASEYRRVLLNHAHVETRTLDADVAEQAAQLRAKYRLKKAPDAIQLATAKLAGVDVFFTNDRALKGVTEVSVVLVSECVEPMP